ncbi:hypothetical protein JB92DRAFT_3144516 [Gautieria morchelliformis]|nr:hypothetical protein JB92DRAFT_3144516 [Gautieria morchelliformis]
MRIRPRPSPPAGKCTRPTFDIGAASSPSRLPSPIHFSHTDAVYSQPKPASPAFLTTTTDDEELSASVQAIERRVMLGGRSRGLQERDVSGKAKENAARIGSDDAVVEDAEPPPPRLCRSTPAPRATLCRLHTPLIPGHGTSRSRPHPHPTHHLPRTPYPARHRVPRTRTCTRMHRTPRRRPPTRTTPRIQPAGVSPPTFTFHGQVDRAAAPPERLILE